MAFGTFILTSTTQGIEIVGSGSGYEDQWTRPVKTEVIVKRQVSGGNWTVLRTFSSTTAVCSVNFVDTAVSLGTVYGYRFDVSYTYRDTEFNQTFTEYYTTPVQNITYTLIEPDKIIRNLTVKSGFSKIILEFDGPSKTGNMNWVFFFYMRDYSAAAVDTEWTPIGTLPWTITGGTSPGSGVSPPAPGSSLLRYGDFSSAKFRVEIPYATVSGGTANWKTRDARRLQFSIATKYGETSPVTHYYQTPVSYSWKVPRTVGLTVSNSLYGIIRANYTVSDGSVDWVARFAENGTFVEEVIPGTDAWVNKVYNLVPSTFNVNTTVGLNLRFYNPSDVTDYFESNYVTAVGKALPYPTGGAAPEINCSAFIGKNAGAPLFMIGRDGLDIGSLVGSTDYYFKSDSNLVFVDGIYSLGATSYYGTGRYGYRSAALSTANKAILGSGKAYMVIGVTYDQEKELLSGYQYYGKTTTGSNIPNENEQFISEGAGGYSFGTAGGLYVDGSSYIYTIGPYADILIVSFNNLLLSGNSLVYNRPVHPGSPGGVYIGRDSFWVGDLDLSKKFISIIPRSAVVADNLVPASNYKDLLIPASGGVKLSPGHTTTGSVPILQIMNHRIDGSTPLGWDIQPNLGRIARGDGAHVWNAGLSASLGLPRPACTANTGVENITVTGRSLQIATGLDTSGTIGKGVNGGGISGSATFTVGTIRSKTTTAICGVAATPLDSYYVKAVPSLNWSDLRNGKVPLYSFRTTSRQNRWTNGELDYFETEESYVVYLAMTSDTTIAYRVEFSVSWQTVYDVSTGLGDPRPGLANITAKVPTYLLNILELN